MMTTTTTTASKPTPFSGGCNDWMALWKFFWKKIRLPPELVLIGRFGDGDVVCIGFVVSVDHGFESGCCCCCCNVMRNVNFVCPEKKSVQKSPVRKNMMSEFQNLRLWFFRKITQLPKTSWMCSKWKNNFPKLQSCNSQSKTDSLRSVSSCPWPTTTTRRCPTSAPSCACAWRLSPVSCP